VLIEFINRRCTIIYCRVLFKNHEKHERHEKQGMIAAGKTGVNTLVTVFMTVMLFFELKISV